MYNSSLTTHQAEEWKEARKTLGQTMGRKMDRMIDMVAKIQRAAYHADYYAMVKCLDSCVVEGEDLDYIDRFRWTPLCHACAHPNGFNVAKLLVERGAKVNYLCYYSSSYSTPLSIAIIRGHCDTARYLMDFVDPTTGCYSQRGRRDFACLGKLFHRLRHEERRGAYLNHVLQRAYETDQSEMVWKQVGVEMSQQKAFSEVELAQRKATWREIAMGLVQKGARLESFWKDESPLMTTLLHRDFGLARFFLENGQPTTKVVNQHRRGHPEDFPLAIAIRNKKWKLVALLLRSQASVARVAPETIIATGTDVFRETTKMGLTLIELATTCKRVDMIYLLVAAHLQMEGSLPLKEVDGPLGALKH